MTLIVNLFGGPGAGKSTTASQVFTELKWGNISVELVTEFAKDLVWEDRQNALLNQLYIFGKQHHRINRIINKVDVIITDSPLLLSSIYGKGMPDSFHPFVMDMFNSYDNLNFYLERKKSYNPIGRLQTEAEAIVIDACVKVLLDDKGIDYEIIEGNRDGGKKIAKIIRGCLHQFAVTERVRIHSHSLNTRLGLE